MSLRGLRSLNLQSDGDRPKLLIRDLALLTVRRRGRSPPPPPAGAHAGPSPATFGVSGGRAALSARPGDFPRLPRSSRQPLRSGLRLGLAQGDHHLTLEQVPGPIARPLQAQVLIRATAAALPATEDSRIPVQPLQVQQPLIQRPMPRLVHPQHAVHPLHRAARAHRPTQTDATAGTTPANSGRSSDRGSPAPAQPPGDSPPPRPGPRPAAADAATTAPPRRRATPPRPRVGPARRGADPGTSTTPCACSSPRTLDHSGPDSKGKAEAICCSRPRPIVQAAVGTEQTQGRLGLLPTGLGLLGPAERRLRLAPGRKGRPRRAPRSRGPAVALVPPPGVAASACSQSRSARFHIVLEGAAGLPLGVEDVQALLQRDGVGLVHTAVLSELGDPRLQPGTRVADDPAQRAPGLQFRRTRSNLGDCRPSSPRTTPCCAVRRRPGPRDGGRRSHRGSRPGSAPGRNDRVAGGPGRRRWRRPGPNDAPSSDSGSAGRPGGWRARRGSG